MSESPNQHLERVQSRIATLRGWLSELRSERAQARRQALETAACDICPICGERSPGEPLDGPNEARNYSHGGELCPASVIWARVAFEYRITHVEPPEGRPGS